MKASTFGVKGILLAVVLATFSHCKSKNKADISNKKNYSEIENTENKLNVLFIAVDDLRPYLGSYGAGFAITPNMDELAAKGRLFKNHYVQVATCGASRSSMLTSQLPKSKKELLNEPALMAHIPKESALSRTFPELFKKNGYETVCIGKISHSDDGWKEKSGARDSTNFDIPNGWTKILTPLGKWKQSLVVAYPNGKDRDDGSGFMPYSLFTDVEDNELPDGMFAETAIDQLKEFAKNGKPFFMGLGFMKPHLPFVAPQKYLDLYKDVSIPSVNKMKRGDTKNASKSGEFYKYVTNRPFKTPKKDETLSEKDAQDIRRAYMACVTYTDTQIGKVLKTLEESGLAENTVIVLWGDHGWHLGENNVWGKHTPLEKGLHSPLIIKIGNNMNDAGKPTESLASSIDIFPTLIDICQLEIKKTDKPLEGISLLPVLEQPNRRVRTEVVSFWRNSATIVNDTHRLIVSENKSKNSFNYELYNHKTDSGELHNIAESNAVIREKMMDSLKKAYPSVLVKNNTLEKK